MSLIARLLRLLTSSQVLVDYSLAPPPVLLDLQILSFLPQLQASNGLHSALPFGVCDFFVCA
jgi:hypothetical protein